VAVGDRLIVFNAEANARVIGGVDIAGKRTVKGFGDRIQISPPVAAEAAGGPLLDLSGRVVAILGGSLTPGARFEGRAMNLSPALFNTFSAENAATPSCRSWTTLAVTAKRSTLLPGRGYSRFPSRP
jgi:hypothetical protein